jgi:catechol 2,3-dioxygenase-like lactoylglutathione lyase family enzyme
MYSRSAGSCAFGLAAAGQRVFGDGPILRALIAGAHAIVFAEDAEAARAFFRDVLEFLSVDAGDGWLIFALPPAELACHPGPGWGLTVGQHMLFLMCQDVHRTVSELERKGVEFVAPIEDEGYGLVTRFKVPGAGEMGLYEPRHPSPLGEFSAG